jgi:hypothetical protein
LQDAGPYPNSKLEVGIMSDSGEGSKLNEGPWYKHLIIPANVCLLVGLLLMLVVAGQVKIGAFGLDIASELPISSRYLLSIMGASAILAGISIHLYQHEVWQSGLGIVYLLAMSTISSGFGFWLLESEHDRVTALFPWYNVTENYCEARASVDSFQKYRRTHDLILACFKSDTAKNEYDATLEISDKYRIEDIGQRTMKAIFTEKFSNALDDGDSIGFFLCVVPTEKSLDGIDTVKKFEDAGCKCFGSVYHDVRSASVTMRKSVGNDEHTGERTRK